MTEESVLRIAESDREVAACFALMQVLKPHLRDSNEFVVRWRKQQRQSYRLLVAWDGGTPLALAGYRYQDNLLHGPHLYVDDLVTAEQARGTGLGARLIDWLKLEAADHGFDRLVLDAALGNALGHRFYFKSGLLARGLQFWLEIEKGSHAT